jgi:O-antigen ligase
MEMLLLTLAAFVRPLASIKYGEALFDVLGVGLFGLLMGAMLVTGAVRQSLRISAIDLLILAITVWCLTIYVVYLEAAQFRYVLKMVIPLLSYVAAKNILRSTGDYQRLLKVIIVSFTIPIFLSAALILTGAGVDRVNYWTGVARWEGAYVDAHSLGHSMTLFLMTMVLYWTLAGADGHKRSIKWLSVSVMVSAVALYCLYMSQVRTAILGLLVFALVYFWFFNRKLLFIGAGAFAVLASATVAYWLPALLPEIAAQNRGVEVDITELGSSRPQYWMHDFLLYLRLPLDQKLAGIGIGTGDPAADTVVEHKLYGHNDWLDVLTQTGLVGLLLFLVLQICIFKAILRLPAKERYVFLAMFFAVLAMMSVSNSYVWRIQVTQLYYILLGFIELKHRKDTVDTPANETLAASPKRAYPARMGYR